MTIQRYLDDFESSLKGFPVTMKLQCDGTVREDAMSKAYALLASRHPLLRAQMRSVNQRTLLYVRPDTEPSFEILKANDDESVINTPTVPLNTDRTVAKLTVTRAPIASYVSLTMDHSVCDGSLLFAVFRDFWSFYTDIVNGDKSNVEPGTSLPAPPIETLHSRTGWRPRLKQNTPIEICSAITRTVRLGRDETNKLLGAVRRFGTTVTALVSGIIFVVNRNQSSSIDVANMTGLFVINMRRRVEPEVGQTDATIFSANYRPTIQVPLNADPIEIGRIVKAKLDSATVHNGITLDPMPSPPLSVDTSIEQRYATLLISSVGELPVSQFRHPRELAITALHPAVRTMTTFYPNFGIWTEGDRLRLRIVYPADLFTYKEVDTITIGIESMLKNIPENISEYGSSAEPQSQERTSNASLI